MRTMTITEALVELKLLDKRINSANVMEWCGLKTKSQTKIFGKTVEEYTEDTKARYQSIIDLIAERAKIKAAIVKSNAETKVKIGDAEMTVADAIEYKTSVRYEIELLNSLNAVRASVENERLAHERLLEREISNVINKLAESGKDNLSQEQKDFAESYRKMNEPQVIDPLGIDKKIEELDNKISSFNQNVDTALSISNATTFISI